jgi:hypothetical protein
MCNEALVRRGLKAQDEISYAANHFRAILDLLYRKLEKSFYPSYLKGATEDYLDTEDEKSLLLKKAAMMLPYLSSSESGMLQKWIEDERKPGYKA